MVRIGHENIAEMNLVRLYHDGKLADYCNMVEIIDMTGKVFYRDLRTISLNKESLNKDSRYLPIYCKGQNYFLVADEALLKNKEILTPVLLYDKLDLTKTAEFEKSRRAKIEQE